MLPKMNGLDILREMRERHVKTPVLLLTARDGLDDRVRGLALAPMITWSNLLRFLSYLPASAPCCADPIANRKPIPHGRLEWMLPNERYAAMGNASN